MKKNAYADTTIKNTAKRLQHLQRNCNLQDPENVKGFIANKKCSNAYKETLIEAYDILMRSINQQWQKPFYKRNDKLPKISKECYKCKEKALLEAMGIEVTWEKKEFKF